MLLTLHTKPHATPLFSAATHTLKIPFLFPPSSKKNLELTHTHFLHHIFSHKHSFTKHVSFNHLNPLTCPANIHERLVKEKIIKNNKKMHKNPTASKSNQALQNLLSKLSKISKTLL